MTEQLEKVIIMQSNIRLTIALRQLATDYNLSFDELRDKYVKFLDNEPDAQVPFSGGQKHLEVIESSNSLNRLSTESHESFGSQNIENFEIKCIALTQKGERCKRNKIANENYCKSHFEKRSALIDHDPVIEMYDDPVIVRNYEEIKETKQFNKLTKQKEPIKVKSRFLTLARNQ